MAQEGGVVLVMVGGHSIEIVVLVGFWIIRPKCVVLVVLGSMPKEI